MPPGHVLVVDTRRETRVASGGEILTARLKVRGAAGWCQTARCGIAAASLRSISGLRGWRRSTRDPSSHGGPQRRDRLWRCGWRFIPGDIIVGDEEGGGDSLPPADAAADAAAQEG